MIGDLMLMAVTLGDTVALAMTGFGDFIFQAMFAATGATIVSGAVAERVAKFIYDLCTCIRWNCVSGSRFVHWGGGVLEMWLFKDFAGSTVVHAFGGFEP